MPFLFLCGWINKIYECWCSLLLWNNELEEFFNLKPSSINSIWVKDGWPPPEPDGTPISFEEQVKDGFLLFPLSFSVVGEGCRGAFPFAFTFFEIPFDEDREIWVISTESDDALLDGAGDDDDYGVRVPIVFVVVVVVVVVVAMAGVRFRGG